MLVGVVFTLFLALGSSPSQAAEEGIRAAVKRLVAASPKMMLEDELKKDKLPHLNISLRISKRTVKPLLDWEKNVRKSSKWIVVSTNRHPTSALRSLAVQTDWNMVVVGTRNTPADWQLKGAVFLDLKRQEQLEYAVTKFLPEDSFTRKTIGYLFALRHGAKVIYDTDDNSELFKKLDLKFFNLTKVFYTEPGARVGKGTLVFNPKLKQPKGREEPVFTRNVNAHFGQPNTWPRGFPLQDIGVGVFSTNYMTAGQDVRAYVQHVLANGDPDLDAIFRQTRKPVGKMISFNFDMDAPPVLLPPGVYAPFNAMSTLFHKEAFWAMALPPTKNDFVPDIWRAYALERLIGEIGGQVLFLPPALQQAGEPRNLESDYALQHTLYYKTGALLDYLHKWRSSKQDILGKLLDLVVGLAREGFYSKADAQFTEVCLVLDRDWCVFAEIL